MNYVSKIMICFTSYHVTRNYDKYTEFVKEVNKISGQLRLQDLWLGSGKQLRGRTTCAGKIISGMINP